MSDYEKNYDRWADNIQKFDYYIVGIIGAGLILLIRDLKIDLLGINSDTIRVIGVLFIIISFIAGIIRLEKQHMLFRFETEKTKISNHRNYLKTGNKNVIMESNYELMTKDELKDLTASIDRNYVDIKYRLKKVGEGMTRAYKVRNWALLIGIITLFLAVFIDPLVSYLHNNADLALCPKG